MSSLGSALFKEYKEETSNTEENEEFIQIRDQISKTFKIEETPGKSKNVGFSSKMWIDLILLFEQALSNLVPRSRMKLSKSSLMFKKR